MSEADSVEMLRRDHSALAQTVGSLTIELRLIKDFIIEMQTDRAVRRERDQNLSDRLSRIEKSIELLDKQCKDDFNSIKALGKWLLIAFGTVIIAAIGNFLINGGFSVPH